jgi:hypothetical protein
VADSGELAAIVSDALDEPLHPLRGLALLTDNERSKPRAWNAMPRAVDCAVLAETTGVVEIPDVLV